MTNKDRKAEIRERMAITGESYAEACRQVIEARPRSRRSAEPEKIYVRYTYTRDGELEFDAAEWTNALSNERQRMIEQAVGEELDDSHRQDGSSVVVSGPSFVGMGWPGGSPGRLPPGLRRRHKGGAGANR